jgi:hypothetical protein
MSDVELLKMARLAQRGDRMATGALYGALADRIEELEAKLQKWVGVLEWLDDDTITRVDWVAGGGDPAGEFCRLGLSRTMPDGTELFRTYVAMDEWTPRRPNPFGLGIDGGDA